MKSFFAIFLAALGLLACTINATAVPQAQGLSMGSVQISGDNIALVELEVTDDRFPGVTFTGTGESVFEEMKALKPEAFPNTNALDVAQARSLHRRSTLNCEWGRDVFGFKACNDGWNRLQGLHHTLYCVNGGVNHCAIVSCSYNCAVYLCNLRNTRFCALGSDIGADMDYIRNHCDSDSSKVPAGRMDFDEHWIGLSMTNC
ncbi:hypothetical protein BKA58DRAFT_436450 [Alternaria rosae]|uniref:uncharacterized protein n=1 Tax=Alternaria rosae TaxID=1187941 RepID=UPI001E8D82CC|nr:uncharacterized protein BKA58DRAFT_436450 [Alternaria rosae]KAH6878758.1 hypothetical protein BKA58DRAFT_436450 [Alternaria rosae]